MRCVEGFYDGWTLYGGGEVENGDVILRYEGSYPTDAKIAQSEPADRVDAADARAVAAYWQWAVREAA